MKCPYCGGKMVRPSAPPYMGSQQTGLYERVVSAGPGGVLADKLMKDLFLNRSPNTLRSCVYRVNRKIAPMKIEGRNKSYFLTGP